MYISHVWVEANGCGVCMPISLEPGVGIQLTIPPFPSLAGCTCCLTLRPDSGFAPFSLILSPVDTCGDSNWRLSDLCDHSALLSCSYWSACWGAQTARPCMFYISAPQEFSVAPVLVVTPKTWRRAFVEKFFMLCILWFTKCSSFGGGGRGGLYYVEKDSWHTTRTNFKQRPLCHIAVIFSWIWFPRRPWRRDRLYTEEALSLWLFSTSNLTLYIF